MLNTYLCDILRESHLKLEFPPAETFYYEIGHWVHMAGFQCLHASCLPFVASEATNPPNLWKSLLVRTCM